MNRETRPPNMPGDQPQKRVITMKQIEIIVKANAQTLFRILMPQLKQLSPTTSLNGAQRKCIGVMLESAIEAGIATGVFMLDCGADLSELRESKAFSIASKRATGNGE